MKTQAKSPYSQVVAEGATPGFQVTTTQVVHETRFYALSRDGSDSIGQSIDRRIGEALERGTILQSITVEIDLDTWDELRLANHQGRDPLYTV